MIDLYYWPTPNGHKVPIMLEECRLEYNVKPINMLKGDQFETEYLKLNPNNKIPTIVDHNGPGGVVYPVFESGAILLYLADKEKKFIPEDEAGRFETIQWLFFQMANIGPMFGQCGHFLQYAPERIQYGVDRYQGETQRLYRVLDKRLGDVEYIAGAYSIADMAIFPWVKINYFHEINIDDYPNVKNWRKKVGDREAVIAGCKLLEESMKLGDPDEEGFNNLFKKQKEDLR
ncbi:MAG: glutathione S-transferase [Rhodospirillaceae bacterium]|nr:glutathione S-transferase [Rhodospirillaceae bacterium]